MRGPSLKLAKNIQEKTVSEMGACLVFTCTHFVVIDHTSCVKFVEFSKTRISDPTYLVNTNAFVSEYDSIVSIQITVQTSPQNIRNCCTTDKACPYYFKLFK